MRTVEEKAPSLRNFEPVASDDPAWAAAYDRLVAFGEPPDIATLTIPAARVGLATDEVVRGLSDALIAGEQQLASLPETIRGIQSTLVDMAELYLKPDFMAERRAYSQSRDAGQGLLDRWLAYQMLLADAVGYWRSALAVAEHNLEWQAYTNAQSGPSQ